MTLADELRTAAEQLRQLATDATAGPWHQHDTHLDLGGHTATVLTSREDINQTELVAWVPTWSHEPWDDTRNAWNNAAYMAAVHPTVGTALAELLEYHAKSCDAAEIAANRVFVDEAAERERFIARQTNPHALAVARALLGTQP
jgi:hypothetical protein